MWKEYVPVKIQPRPAASIMPPLSIVKVAGARLPPILFWPSSSWPMVPNCPPEAVRPNEHERGERAAAPKASERAMKECIITIECT